MNQRDRVQLTAYHRQLKAESPEWFYARKVLQDTVRIAHSISAVTFHALLTSDGHYLMSI